MYMLEVQLACYGIYLFQSAFSTRSDFVDKITYHEYHIPYYQKVKRKPH